MKRDVRLRAIPTFAVWVALSGCADGIVSTGVGFGSVPEVAGGAASGGAWPTSPASASMGGASGAAQARGPASGNAGNASSNSPAGGAANHVGVPAKPADSFLDMVGVNGHLNYEGTVYTDRFEDAIAPRTAELGIRHWRDALSAEPSVLARQQRLAEFGVRFDLIVHDLDVASTLSAAKKSLSVATAIEGPNELDHGYRNGVPVYPDASTRTYQGIGFPGVVAAFQNDLYQAIKSDPETQHLAVLMAGFSFPDNTLDVGLVAGCDCGNTHSYPDGGLPTFRLDDWYIPRMRVNSGTEKPLCATETGYHNTPLPNGSHWIPAVSERAAAKYELRLLLEYFNRGFQKVYLYEFANVAPSNQVADLNFGLLTSDGRPKVQFIAIKNLLALLADPGPAFTPGHLDFELNGDPSELRHTVLQKRDGTFYLVLWLDELSFAPEAKQDIDVAHPVHLSLRSAVSRIEFYRPVEAATVLRDIAGKPELDVEVSDQPLVLRLTP